MNYNVLPLFSQPVYTSEGQEPTETLLEYARSLSYKNVGNGNFDISNNTYVLDLEEFQDTRNLIQGHINTYAYDILGIKESYEIYLLNSWIVKYKAGSYANKHHHYNSLLSGTYYLNTPDDDESEIEFTTPNWYNIFPLQLQPEISHWNIFNSKTWALKPQRGYIYQFPSHLDHSVKTVTGDGERLTLAWNCYIRGEFGGATDSKIDCLTLK